ncbi:SurA N-terminal domain-containing protein [Chlamydiales bacterium]|nr:SurA N-terminal domain-containing protein [Chlamydiales bacterium]
MLQFFRRFQKGFFIVITIVIVISFSFFGTYGALDRGTRGDTEVFTAVDGSQIMRSEVEQMVQFLSTDRKDQMNWGSPLGPNFLNDGVVRKDFIESGLGEVLLAHYGADFEDEWLVKQKKERVWHPYRHPEVSFVSAEMIWNQFAPALGVAYRSYKKGDWNTSLELFQRKSSLYLAEGEFSHQMLRQVLYYQMQNNQWIKPDPNVQNQDLSIFGYHSVSDWFGNDFLRLVSGFIINSAKWAEKEGYVVSKEEALYDLKKNAVAAFESQKQNPKMTISSAQEYFKQQLRYLGMDPSQAAHLWQKVMLFRKAFQDLGSAMFVAPEQFQPYMDWVNEQAEVITYSLPKEFQIGQFRDWQRLNIYLTSLSKGEKEKGFPKAWLRDDEIIAKTPELALKRYLVEIQEVHPKMVGSRVGLKEMWNWQASEYGQNKLAEYFPALNLKEIDQLDDMARADVDYRSRSLMALEHPEWIEEALVSETPKIETLYFFKKGGKSPLKGLHLPQKALAILENQEMDTLTTWNDLGDKIWRVKLLDRSSNWEVATYAEAIEGGVLEEILLGQLEMAKGNSFSDKPLSDVRDEIAQELFRSDLNRLKVLAGKDSSIDVISSTALKPYMESVLNELQKDRENSLEYVQNEEDFENENLLPLKGSIKDQFKLVADMKLWDRTEKSISFKDVLKKESQTFSDIVMQTNGNLFFYQMLSVGDFSSKEEKIALINKEKELLSKEVQRALMEELVTSFKAKNALTLEKYHDKKKEMEV